MNPTFTPNDLAIANPLAYFDSKIQRFDIVVIKAPRFSQQKNDQTGDVRFIERVIGLPN
jgi:signal peptidase I